MSQITFCQFELFAPNGVPNLAVSLLVKKMREMAYYKTVHIFKNAHEMQEALLKELDEVCAHNASEKKRISITVTSLGPEKIERKYINLVYNDSDDTKKVTLMAQILVDEKGAER